MTDYKDIMSNRTDSELLEITTILKDDYQPEAIIAAEMELKNRNLTNQQLVDAQNQIDSRRNEDEKKKEKLRILQKKTANLADIFNPLSEKSIEKQTKIVTIGLTIAFLVYVIKNWGLTILMLQDIGNTDLRFLEYFAPLVLFPIGLFGFWTTKKYGWVILTILLTYLTVTTLFTMGIEIKWAMQTPVQFDNSGLVQLQVVENSALEELFGRKGFAFYIGQLVLFAGLLIFLNRKSIIKKYIISKQTQLLTIGLTALPFMFFGLLILT